ncbi:MAG: hypothetical protein ACRD3C_14895 [Vicinamibacterales bacterium]
MKSVLSMVIAGVVLSGAVFVGQAEGGDRRNRSAVRRVEVRYDHRGDRYYRDRDIVVIREYYRPYYRPLPPGLRQRYYRTGSLPPGWAKRMRPVPVYIEPELVVLPRGYRRGIIDGHAVVYNDRGFLIDVAVLF